MRALIITAYKLIICVAPCATGSELAVSESKLKTIPNSTPGCSGGLYSAKSNSKKLLIVLKMSSLGTSSRQSYPSKVSSYMKSVVSCSY